LLAATVYLGNPDRNHKLWNIVSTVTDIFTPYADTAGMLLHINGRFIMGKLKSSLLSYSFVLNCSSKSIARCGSRYEADLSVSMVSLKTSSMG